MTDLNVEVFEEERKVTAEEYAESYSAFFSCHKALRRRVESSSAEMFTNAAVKREIQNTDFRAFKRKLDKVFREKPRSLHLYGVNEKVFDRTKEELEMRIEKTKKNVYYSMEDYRKAQGVNS